MACFHRSSRLPERRFVAALRQKVLEELPLATPAVAVELDQVAEALQGLTFVEKQAAWLETMGYAAAKTGLMLRMAPATVEKIRARASELLAGEGGPLESNAAGGQRHVVGAGGGGEEDGRVSGREAVSRYARGAHVVVGA